MYCNTNNVINKLINTKLAKMYDIIVCKEHLVINRNKIISILNEQSNLNLYITCQCKKSLEFFTNCNKMQVRKV